MRRCDSHRALLRALMARYPGLLVLDSRAEPWASVTFTGARHILTCAPGGGLAGAEEAEFDLPGHVLADLTVAQENGRTIIEALTIETA
jgi:hypothetical protein